MDCVRPYSPVGCGLVSSHERCRLLGSKLAALGPKSDSNTLPITDCSVNARLREQDVLKIHLIKNAIINGGSEMATRPPHFGGVASACHAAFSNTGCCHYSATLQRACTDFGRPGAPTWDTKFVLEVADTISEEMRAVNNEKYSKDKTNRCALFLYHVSKCMQSAGTSLFSCSCCMC